MFNRGYLFHGVLDTGLLKMAILGHAVKGKKLQAIIFSCHWQYVYTISSHVKNLSRHKIVTKTIFDMTCENFITKRKRPFETNQNGLYFFLQKKIVNLGSVYNEIGSPGRVRTYGLSINSRVLHH